MARRKGYMGHADWEYPLNLWEKTVGAFFWHLSFVIGSRCNYCGRWSLSKRYYCSDMCQTLDCGASNNACNGRRVRRH